MPIVLTILALFSPNEVWYHTSPLPFMMTRDTDWIYRVKTTPKTLKTKAQRKEITIADF